ncbi:MAG TPA: YeeE/YedE family protein [Afipia sp.]|uniref:YeeE/YedE family protein n=1 Tax=unclassified Afipia TaxID=2642050 RepID=UPI0004640F62|nr:MULTISPECIES: YeeE/YedE family protein [unclassified Afipia]MAH70288.1 YeeE/YedE family protein [Afipia sp.]OUX60453.1 MAG: YeeE/YedE family protein [Afipia sp. TMED4]HAQ93737.1 YeeE/YedE family protein [Afipia sp.]HBF52979.1 YeeE/YedE family protein [Afipia sp.]HBR47745.1 YeeE/YedE family protein [Afipia sp.]
MPGIPVSAGFAIGLAFGVVGLLSGFCLMSSLRDWWTANDGRKVRSYALALAIAILGTQLVAGVGLVDIAKSIYLQPSFSAPMIFAGGLLFGFGMVLSNGCASRALVLLGKGNLRSLVVIAIIGIAAQMTLKGLIAPARLALLQATQITPAAVSAPALLATVGIDEFVARIAVTLIVVGGLLIFAFSDRQFRRAYGQIAAGLAVGLLVTAGWLATGWLGADDFNPIPVTSLSFVSPIADTLQYTMLSTGLTLSFGVALVVGVLSGSVLTAVLTGRFKLEGYTSPSHMVRSISGAALMGIGGAMAYGCSIGQGLTGLSTLGMPSFIAVAGIVSGAALGIRGAVVIPALATR